MKSKLSKHITPPPYITGGGKGGGSLFLLFLLVCVLQKPCFFLWYGDAMDGAGGGDLLQIIWHGLKLDLAVTAYLMILPMLLFTIGIWLGRYGWWQRVYGAFAVFYGIVAGLLLSTTFVANIVLYGYWHFPLDSTPLFYLLSSPKDAMASATPWELIGGFATVVVLTGFVTWAFLKIKKGFLDTQKRLSCITEKAFSTAVMLVLCALLIIPIRGGFSVATNNVGGAYFSKDIVKNHNAVNPLFSLLESLSHSEDFASQYRFMDDAQAQKIFDRMTYTALRTTPSDSLLLRRPKHVVMVVMESFSSYIMSEKGHVQAVTGGKAVTPTLDRLAEEGILFTNFYANSFRTDRGLVAILSGFPAQPTTSLMKYPEKTNNLYSIARSLKRAGWRTNYFYGGDANFTNMRSYVLATGFDKLVSEDDFPLKDRTGKWGVPDDKLFQFIVHSAEFIVHSAECRVHSAEFIVGSEKLKVEGGQPSFTVIQTSSSHEPFDVPIHEIEEPALNAFRFTDKVLGEFIENLRKTEEWQETLVVLVPDHQGCYPADMDNFVLPHYQIPLIFVGGCTRGHQRIPVYGSQQDIAATLLGLLGIDHSEFLYSKDMLDPQAPHFAFFTTHDGIGLATDENQLMFDNTSRTTLVDEGTRKGLNLKPSQAYLQKLYDDIAGR